MNILIVGGISALVGCLVTALYCAGTRSQMIREHELDIKGLCKRHNDGLTFDEKQHEKQIEALEKKHAVELLDKYQEGKESDGLIRGAKGRIESVKPKTALAVAKPKAAKKPAKKAAK